MKLQVSCFQSHFLFCIFFDLFLISSDCIGSCYSPGLEDSGERRPLLEVTEEEPPGHMVIEKEQALQEGRPARQGYRDVSLTGCHQSVMPWYRLPAFFGKFEAPDERGIMRIVSTAVSRDRHSDGDTVDSLRQPWLLDKAGCVIGFQNAHGNVASAQEIQDDAEAWAVAFARDVRGVFCQNHDHNCVAACSKYAKPKDGAPDGQGPQLPRRKKLDPRDYCRFLFVCIVEMKVLDKVKKILRRGKELVTSAFVCNTNIRNEYGRVQVVRKHPFRSSSSDICQAFARCNVDVQRNDRVVPVDVASLNLAPINFFYGASRLTNDARHLLASYAEGVRSSHICDFYMTKYLAKGQQVLASAVTPVLHGLQRLDDEVAAGVKVLNTVEDVARAKLRRILFSANRSHWFSACELAIFVLTGGHSIATHIDRPMFLSRVFFMLEEGKRLRNGALQNQFLHEAARALETRTAGVDVVEMVMSTDLSEEVVADSRETVADSHRRDDVSILDVQEHKRPRYNDELPDRDPEIEFQDLGTEDQHVVDENLGVAEERGEDDGVPVEPELLQDEPPLHMFRATVSTYDDWLHRGVFLEDLDFHSYVAHVEVVSLSQSRLGECFVFDEHYIKSKTYWQRLAQRIAVPRVIGASCPRMDVDHGEENARYKLALFSLTRCPGRGACADPTALSKPCLATGKDGSARFRLAWRLRRAQIAVEASKADQKIRLCRKLPVLRDCTTFRFPDDDARYGLDAILLAQIVYRVYGEQQHVGALSFFRIVAELASWLTSCKVFAPEQLHVSEFVAHRSRDMILRLDLHTEARNTAVQQAKAHARVTVEEDAASVGSDEDRILVEVENVGGEAASDAEAAGEQPSEQGQVAGVELAGYLPQDPDTVREHLLQSSLLADARKKGTRVPDAIKYMLEVETALGPRLAVCRESFPVTSQTNWEPKESLTDVLLQQDLQIQALHQLDLGNEDAEAAETAGSRFKAEASVRVASLAERARGPVAVAQMLADEAGLNRDQRGFVAIVAVALQGAWAMLPVAANGMLRKDKVLLRCLLVGGGGCGKTRIINRVLRPLFQAFFGEDAVQTQAPSNKAARQIHGKTMHAANKLQMDASLRTVHLRLTTSTRKTLERSATPLGAMILDEFSQCIGQMLHADALRKTYGRQSAYNLEVHKYAEPLETWGRTPVVVIAGAETVNRSFNGICKIDLSMILQNEHKQTTLRNANHRIR